MRQDVHPLSLAPMLLRSLQGIIRRLGHFQGYFGWKVSGLQVIFVPYKTIVLVALLACLWHWMEILSSSSPETPDITVACPLPLQAFGSSDQKRAVALEKENVGWGYNASLSCLYLIPDNSAYPWFKTKNTRK